MTNSKHNVQMKRLLKAALLGSLTLISACSPKKEQPRPKPPVPIMAAPSAVKSVPVQIRAIGNVEAYNTVAIKAQINGQLAKVHFREGQDVRKGELLFTIDPRPFEAALKQAEAFLAKDQAQARFAQEQARRYGALLKDGIVTQDQYEQLRANAEVVEAAIASDRAMVENARLQLAYCTIRSPIDGRTGALMVQPGNLVKANDLPVLVTINQLSPSYVTFSVPEKSLVDIKKFLAQGELKVTAEIPNDAKGVETGVVSFLDNTVDAATGTIKLKGTFPNKGRRLWTGQFVTVVLTIATHINAVVVPTAAIQTGQQGQYVFIVKADGTADMRPVAVGVSMDGDTVIEKGVQPGETVVTDGQMRLMPGAKVEIKTPGKPGESKSQAGPVKADAPQPAGVAFQPVAGQPQAERGKSK